jgi:hypothetical protein
MSVNNDPLDSMLSSKEYLLFAFLLFALFLELTQLLLRLCQLASQLLDLLDRLEVGAPGTTQGCFLMSQQTAFEGQTCSRAQGGLAQTQYEVR